MNYIKKELDRLDVNSEVVNVLLSDYNGNKTKNLGMNCKEDIQELIAFLTKRLQEVD